MYGYFKSMEKPNNMEAVAKKDPGKFLLSRNKRRAP